MEINTDIFIIMIMFSLIMISAITVWYGMRSDKKKAKRDEKIDNNLDEVFFGLPKEELKELQDSAKIRSDHAKIVDSAKLNKVYSQATMSFSPLINYSTNVSSVTRKIDPTKAYVLKPKGKSGRFGCSFCPTKSYSSYANTRKHIKIKHK